MLLAIISVCTSDGTSALNQISPAQVAEQSDGTVNYTFDLTEIEPDADRIVFFSTHQFVWAYLNGELVYDFTKDGGFWTSSPGCTYNFVPVTAGGRLVIVTKPAYEIVRDEQFTFFVGNGDNIIVTIMRGSVARFVTSILMLILGVGLILYYVILHKRQKLTNELLYLGTFSFIMGMWAYNETDINTIIASNKIFDQLIPYFCMMMIVPPFLMFIHSYLGLVDRVGYKVVLWGCQINLVVLTILHFTKILEYRETLAVMQLLIVAAAVYLLGNIAMMVIKKQYSRRLQICLVGILLFTISVTVDLVSYYSSIGDADRYGRYVYLCFVALLTWDLFATTNEMINKGRKAKELEVFAITDTMTGVYNRNAFETHVAGLKNLDNITVIMCDLNNLKRTNDTFGHDMGDSYIVEAAEIIRDVTSAYGNTYRTGGDEFCVICQNLSRRAQDKVIRAIRTRTIATNTKGTFKFKFGISIGAARYDVENDGSFDDILKRADKNMYEDKRSQKVMIRN